jgi:hypothetical protein
MNISHNDDFKIRLNFVDLRGEPLDPSQIKFKFIYQDCECNTYEVSYNGVNRVNNILKDGVLYAIFNSGIFVRGQLSVVRNYQMPDEDFQDSINDELALLRQKDTKTSEFQAYYQYVEECKSNIKAN